MKVDKAVQLAKEARELRSILDEYAAWMARAAKGQTKGPMVDPSVAKEKLERHLWLVHDSPNRMGELVEAICVEVKDSDRRTLNKLLLAARERHLKFFEMRFEAHAILCELDRYPWPEEEPADKWIYDNLDRMSFENLSVAYRTKKFPGPISSRNAFKNHAARYADFHELDQKDFGGKPGRASTKNLSVK